VTTNAYVRTAPDRFDARYVGRVLRTVSAAEFKVKYADSALGYVWTIAKPLAWFAVLYVVFGRFFKLRATFDNYPVYLIAGIVLWVFFLDATTTALQSFVQHGAVLRRLSVPRLVLPLSSIMTTSLTLVVNTAAFSIIIGIVGVSPRWWWFLIPLPILEICLFTTAVALFLATLFVRARDMGPLWELASQLLFFASPIIYPTGFLPAWAQKAVFANPFVQAMQDVRWLLVPEREITTAADVYGSALGYLIPLGTLLAVVAISVGFYRREMPFLAERA
jgi:ABC-2 type transport system permease protein